MKRKSRWMKSVIAESKKDVRLPWERKARHAKAAKPRARAA